MKAWLVTVTFKDGEKEGVLFTRPEDAEDAFSGACEEGSTLAIAWCDAYGDTDCELAMAEIDI